VGGSTRIRALQQVVKDFFGKETHKGVNPATGRGRRWARPSRQACVRRGSKDNAPASTSRPSLVIRTLGA